MMHHFIVKIVGALWCDNMGLFELNGACILNNARILNFEQQFKESASKICLYTLNRLVKVQLGDFINIYTPKLHLINI